MARASPSGQAESLMGLCKKMHPSFDTEPAPGSLAQPSQLCARDSRKSPRQRACVWTTVLTKVPPSVYTSRNVAPHLRAPGDLNRWQNSCCASHGGIRGWDSSGHRFPGWWLIRGRSHGAVTRRLSSSQSCPPSNARAFAPSHGTHVRFPRADARLSFLARKLGSGLSKE